MTDKAAERAHKLGFLDALKWVRALVKYRHIEYSAWLDIVDKQEQLEKELLVEGASKC